MNVSLEQISIDVINSLQLHNLNEDFYHNLTGFYVIHRIDQIKKGKYIRWIRLDEKRLDEKRLDEKRLDEKRLDEKRLDEKRLDEKRLDEKRLDEKRLDEKRLDEKRLDEKRLDEKRLDEKRLDEKRLDEKRLDEKRLDEKRLDIDEKIPKDKITNGGIVTDIVETSNGNMNIKCKKGVRFFQVSFHNALIFQKLTPEEQCILVAQRLLHTE